MEIEKSDSPDEIYQKVRDYSLVITGDSKLAEALNNRIEKPLVGDFAVTPIELVNNQQNFKREIFLDLADQTDKTWKQLSYILDTILDYWKNTGSLEDVKKQTLLGEEADEIIGYLKESETPYRKLQDSKYDFPEDVAVVDLYQLSKLEKRFLPENFDKYSSLDADETIELPDFSIFESTGDVVEVCKEIVENCRPEQVGIVVHPNSQYQPLIESVFESENIPYITQRGYSESEELRTFVRLLRVGLTMKKVRLKDVQPVIQQLGLKMPEGSENQEIKDVDGLEDFKEFLNVLEYLSFDDLLEKYSEFTHEIDKIESFLEQMDLMGQNISISKVDRMEYYLQRFDPTESESLEGVSLVDPRETSIVDRSTVIFLGMDSSWVEDIPDRYWMDQQKQRDKHVKNFLKLVQSGEKVEFLVQDKEMNEDIKPCFYLNSILDKNFTSFRDLPNKRYKPAETVEGHGFEKQRFPAVETTELEYFSQSSLNKFAKSPRLYFIEKLLSSETDINLRKGNLFHDYAEFHANNPELASDMEVEKIVEDMIDELRRFVDSSAVDSLRTECRIGIKNIRKFFDRNEVEDHGISSYESGGEPDRNYFCGLYDEDIESDFTEVYFERDDLRVRGKIDLILDSSEIVDFKSGKQYSKKKTARRSKVNLWEEQDRPNFQPLMYLAQHAVRVEEGEVLKFTLYNFLSDIGGEVTGESDFRDCLTTFTYYPERFEDKAGSMDLFEHLIKDVAKSNDRRKTLEKLGYTRYEAFFEENQIPEIYSKNEILESEFSEDFESYVKEVVGDYKYVEKGCASALKKLVDFRTENYFVEDIERFKLFVENKIEEMNECRKNGFPVNAKPDELRHRDMISR